MKVGDQIRFRRRYINARGETDPFFTKVHTITEISTTWDGYQRLHIECPQYLSHSGVWKCREKNVVVVGSAGPCACSWRHCRAKAV